MTTARDRLCIVQACPYSWDVPGGVQAHVRALSAHLAARGHEVHVLAPGRRPGRRPGARIVGRAVPVLANGSVARISFGPQVALEVRRALHELRPDIIHAHEPEAPSVSMLAVLSADVPVVATFHSNVGPELPDSFWYQLAVPAMRPMWQRLARRIAVSPAARVSVTSRLGKDDVVIIPNGVDVERFGSAAPARLPPGRHLLFIGRLESRKGFTIAVQAFARLAGSHPDLRMLVIGEGSERCAVEELAPAVRERIDMLGYVDDARLAGCLRAASVCVAPSTGGESFGIVLAEAMAAGTPIVASDIDGYRDVARDGIEAVLVPPGDADMLAAGIGRVLDDDSLAAALRAAGPVRASEFAWDRITDRLVEEYRAVLDGR